jgi:hypothetical protein
VRTFDAAVAVHPEGFAERLMNDVDEVGPELGVEE